MTIQHTFPTDELRNKDLVYLVSIFESNQSYLQSCDGLVRSPSDSERQSDTIDRLGPGGSQMSQNCWRINLFVISTLSASDHEIEECISALICISII